MKFLVLTFAVLLTGCGAQPGSNAATQSELASINQHMAALETRMATLEQSVQKDRPGGTWILWQVTQSVYPQAMSGYPSKADCLIAVSGWSVPGGKLISQDPSIFQLKKSRVWLECLPIGVKPYAH